MKAIYKKELSQYFNSMVGYIFLGIFLLICGYCFTMYNLSAQNSDIKSFFSGILIMVMFVSPMLTMRLFAEEKKIKTEQLLLTSPVSLSGIVIGKYLAAMTVFLIGIVVTFLYPFTLSLYGGFALAETLGKYIGLIIAVSAFISIGMFISVLTENQVVAGVVSYATLICLWLVGYLGQSLTSGGILRTILDWLSLSQRFDEMSMGVFNPASIIYYLSIAVVFLLLTVRQLEQRRWN